MIETLETERLVLRDVLFVDVAAYHKNFVDYDVVSELNAAIPWPYPADGIPAFLEKLRPEQEQNRWVWALYLKTDLTDPISSIDLSRGGKSEHRGFWLAKKHWGRGLMTEATDAVTDYAFDILGFETMILSNALGNVRSRRIKEKAGAVFLRTEPAKFVNPDYTHREVWELTKQAWQRRNFIPPPQ
jgi:RimJ/RimL family protein N-acetyltransferase